MNETHATRDQTDEMVIVRPSPPDKMDATNDWDRSVLSLDGHLLQSLRWGEFKERHGWSVERVSVRVGEARGFAQLLFKRRGPLSLAYLPRGPVVSAAAGATALFAAVDELCRRSTALSLIVEPDRPLPLTGTFRDHGFVRGPAHIQPSRTVKVPLLPDDQMLDQMHQKTRYNVRLAKRRDVAVERVSPNRETMRTFYRLLQDTSERNAFGIHHYDYYFDFARIFGDDAVLLFALIDGSPVAGLISARFGDEAVYMYGGSSTVNRAHGAAFLLQFEAMRWARDRGCRRYDLWGIPAVDPVSTADAGERVATTRGDDWRGLFRFKTGFGGEIVSYPATLERRYRPALAWLARRVYAGHE